MVGTYFSLAGCKAIRPAENRPLQPLRFPSKQYAYNRASALDPEDTGSIFQARDIKGLIGKGKTNYDEDCVENQSSCGGEEDEGPNEREYGLDLLLARYEGSVSLRFGLVVAPFVVNGLDGHRQHILASPRVAHSHQQYVFLAKRLWTPPPSVSCFSISSSSLEFLSGGL